MKQTIEPEWIVILTYRDPHAAAFNRLNRAWLEEHALLEDGDRKQLGHPRESILARSRSTNALTTTGRRGRPAETRR